MRDVSVIPGQAVSVGYHACCRTARNLHLFNSISVYENHTISQPCNFRRIWRTVQSPAQLSLDFLQWSVFNRLDVSVIKVLNADEYTRGKRRHHGKFRAGDTFSAKTKFLMIGSTARTFAPINTSPSEILLLPVVVNEDLLEQRIGLFLSDKTQSPSESKDKVRLIKIANIPSTCHVPALYQTPNELLHSEIKSAPSRP